MEEKTYRVWDLAVKFLGFAMTVATLYFGFWQINEQQQMVDKQQKMAADFEIKKNFWMYQSQVYTEICKSAGAMVANIENHARFQEEKAKFLTQYYGTVVLVEDSTVESRLVFIRSYLEDFDPRDSNMVLKLKSKVLDLANACKNSSVTFKPSILP